MLDKRALYAATVLTSQSKKSYTGLGFESPLTQQNDSLQLTAMYETEVDRLASSIHCLSQWRDFKYKPRVVRFVPETGCSSGTEAQKEMTLSQFSAAEVPKCHMEAEQGPHSLMSTQSRKDYILYAGGLVWALDWCPRSEQKTEHGSNYEYIAIAAHPPDSTYHKLGAPISGRGMVQIWCILNYTTNEEATQFSAGSMKKKDKKNATAKKVDNNKPSRPRGRPRKNIVNTPSEVDLDSQFIEDLDKDPQSISASQNMPSPVLDNMHSQNNPVEKENNTYKRRKRKPMVLDEDPIDLLESEFIPALSVRFPDPMDVLPIKTVPMQEKPKIQKALHNEDTSVDITAEVSDSERPSTSELGKRKKIPTKKFIENDLDFRLAAFKTKSRKKSKSSKDRHSDNSGFSTLKKCTGSLPSSHKETVVDENPMTPEENAGGSSLHDKGDDILPRAVLCLGHDGKVAWDVKWRPVGCESVNEYRMGYLAVVLGNGFIEVWEVPSPEVVSRIYAFRQTNDIDPRFAKLKPVFRCSRLNHGDRLSMPLTVEWSASPPHDLLLAGCHDGMVAVWKFSTEQSEDARPLICFNAETGPIRSLMWAPSDGDPESSNVIVTAGHGGLKFWDVRDPYRPLWDANPSQRYIYGLDWLPDPRCILVTYDDGNMRTLSLLKSAYDVPVTGEPFSGTLQQGLHSYSCSSFSIWSIHASRQTGIVAYSCADGTVLYFQLTHKAVEKDATRNRAPHFLCGSLVSEGSAVTLNTELPNLPHRMKKSATEWSNTPRSARTVASGSNQGRQVKKDADKSPNHGEDVLALCYGDDAEGAKSGSAKTSKSNGGAAVKSDMKDDKTQSEIEPPPPKSQAMYRVRWNMNKGSERWLCYGGAAGIVRCQEIVIPQFDKKLLKH